MTALPLIVFALYLFLDKALDTAYGICQLFVQSKIQQKTLDKQCPDPEQEEERKPIGFNAYPNHAIEVEDDD